MGYYATVTADFDALTEHDVDLANKAADVSNSTLRAPVSGYVWRNGRAVPFTLETAATAPRHFGALPEQLVIAVLLLASFMAPIFHLLG